METRIVHITSRPAWEAAQRAGLYTADTLASEGFIHCSTTAQILSVANTLYHGQTGLVLLIIDVTRLQAPLRYEDCYASGQAYPHLYGPLNLDAVSVVYDFSPQPDGTFRLPDALT